MVANDLKIELRGRMERGFGLGLGLGVGIFGDARRTSSGVATLARLLV